MNTALISFKYPHIAVSFCSDYLLSKGKNVIGVYLFDIREKALEKLIKFLNEEHIGVVGLSVASSYFQEAIYVSEFIRRHSKVKIVFGGCHPTLCPEECIPHCDVVCIGAGEETLFELVEAFENNQLLGLIKGIWYNQEGKIIRTPHRSIVDNIDSVFNSIEFSKRRDFFLLSSGVKIQDYSLLEGYSTITGRGCLFNCTYCCTPAYNRALGVRGFRKRGIDNVIDELKKAKNFFPKLKYIRFFSEIFPFTGKDLDELMDKYVTQIKLPFSAYHHINLLTKGDLIKLKVAGLNTLFIGLQHGSQKFRKQMYNRFETNDNTLKVMREAVDAGIPFPVLDIILAPEIETVEDLKESIRFLVQLPRKVKLKIFRMKYYPKTPLSEKLLAEDKIGIDRLVQYIRGSSDNWHWDFRQFTYSEENSYYYWVVFLVARVKLPVFVYFYFLNCRNIVNFRLIQFMLLGTIFWLEAKKISLNLRLFVKQPGRASLRTLIKKILHLFHRKTYIPYFVYPNEPLWFPAEPIYNYAVKN